MLKGKIFFLRILHSFCALGEYMKSIWGYLRYTKSSQNARKVFKRIRRIRGKNLCVHGEDAKRLLDGVFSLYAKRYKSVYISVNKNTNLNLFKILSNYIIWDRLSQKTISRYCPFKFLCAL
jgi:hypothetical protein